MKSFEGVESRFEFTAVIIGSGIGVLVVLGVIVYFFQLSKGLAKSETRAETVKEVKQSIEGVAEAARYMAKDKDFHKAAKKEFRPQIIIFAVLGIVFLLMFLGVEG